MNNYEAEGIIISKQYDVKDIQNSKKQAVLLDIISTVMPILLTKYLNLLALDSTSHCNSLNFPNTAFIVRSADKSIASSFLESYLCQKEANSYKKDELKLSKKRGPKNKRKSQLVLSESIYLQDTNMPYKTVKIVEIIDKSRVIVEVTFESDNTD
ncbi:8108_t:CDS:2 [Cetraspora pellucida]|uniref:8108_t:CDS:1 n=1 Tax=Cetraspora pellucida TaxID=1433469 RepID=A0A9N8ZN33_9GLOM|nr:8108_t:CDS:2 [Cetraspora pellucida]